MGRLKTRYKFLRQPDGRHSITSEHGKMSWQVGKWYKHDGEVKLCNGGFHCSDNIWEALTYVKGEVLAEVVTRGASDIGDDKSAWAEMKIVRAYRWTPLDSVPYAIYAVEQVVAIYEDIYPHDNRPREAIEAAKAYVAQPSKKNARAAADAAGAADAAYGAARAADAAYGAARAADAAYGAARAAAWAAYAADAADAAYGAASAARAARAQQERWLRKHMESLEVVA